ncbi:16270_t:CDS:2, partial [Acaulospora morrowiae]
LGNVAQHECINLWNKQDLCLHSLLIYGDCDQYHRLENYTYGSSPAFAIRTHLTPKSPFPDS